MGMYSLTRRGLIATNRDRCVASSTSQSFAGVISKAPLIPKVLWTCAPALLQEGSSYVSMSENVTSD